HLLSHRVAGNAVRVRVSCRIERSCAGTIVLRTADQRGTHRLGSARFAVGRGHPRVIKVELGPAARRILRRAGRRGALVTVQVHRPHVPWTYGVGGRVTP
ncbi:MAG: hypothetical protein JWR63_2320, partial [Conexibacter sp.]|nr:hypothetical protein [Conexibacter sp.]